MKLAALLAQEDKAPFFSGPTFFLGLVLICFLLMLVTVVREWRLKRKQNASAQLESDTHPNVTEDDNDDPHLTKADKKQAALEAKLRG